VVVLGHGCGGRAQRCRGHGGDALEHLRRDGVLHPLEAAVGYVFPYGF